MKTIDTKSLTPALFRFLPYVILIAVGAVMPLFVRTNFWLHIFIVVFVRCVGAVGLRTIALSGNISFAQAAFVGVGAYTAAILAVELGMPAYLTIPLSTILVTILGVVTGLPFVRLRSIYFGMATMFLGAALVYIISAMPITGGSNGLSNIPTLFRSMNMTRNYYFFFILAIVSCVIMYRFEFSRIGVILRALAQSPDAAAAIGVGEVYFRLLAVGFGCFFAGLSGATFAHYNTSLSPTSYGMAVGLWYIMYVMIGGKDSFIGPIIGTILLVIIPEMSRALNQYAPYITVAAMLIVAYFLPGGLASIPGTVKRIVAKKKTAPGSTKTEGGA